MHSLPEFICLHAYAAMFLTYKNQVVINRIPNYNTKLLSLIQFAVKFHHTSGKVMNEKYL